MIARLASAVLMTACSACAPHLAGEPQQLTGAFRGETAEGAELTLHFDQEGEAFRAEGTLDDEAVVLAGAVGWRGSASLATAGGRSELVELTLSGSGESLVLETPGGDTTILHRLGDTGPAPSSGAFGGRYAARSGRAPVAEVTLVQNGSLLAGVGVVTGDAVGVSGRVTSAEAAEGVVTFRDGSQVSFDAHLGGDGTLTVRGFGEPIELRRTNP